MQLLNVMFYVQEMELAILSVFLLIAVLVLLFDHHRSTEQIRKYEEQIKKDNELLRKYEGQVKECEKEIELYYPYYMEKIERDKEKRERLIKEIEKSEKMEPEEKKRRIQRVRDAELL